MGVARHWAAGACFAAAVALSLGPASAQQSQNRTWCVNRNNAYSPDLAIGGALRSFIPAGNAGNVWQSSSTTAASHTKTRKTTTAPSPTGTRRSGSIRNLLPPTSTAAPLTTTKATTTWPSPTAPWRSGSIRKMRRPSTTAATLIGPKAATTAPSPTTTRRSGSIRPRLQGPQHRIPLQRQSRQGFG
jgi:hypothetical protein